MKTLFEIASELLENIKEAQIRLEKNINNLAYYEEKATLDEEEIKMRDFWQSLVDEKKAELKRMEDAYKLLTA